MYTKDKNEYLHFRISHYDYELLKNIAFDYNISVSLLCRNIILKFIGEYNANIKSNIDDKL